MGSCPHCGGTPTDHVDCCLAYGNARLTTSADDNVPSIEQVMAERDEARALVLEMFRRNCLDTDLRSHRRGLYDHMCSATYEEAQAALISWGLVKREECVRP